MGHPKSVLFYGEMRDIRLNYEQGIICIVLQVHVILQRERESNKNCEFSLEESPLGSFADFCCFTFPYLFFISFVLPYTTYIYIIIL